MFKQLRERRKRVRQKELKETEKWKKDHIFVYDEEVNVFIGGEFFSTGVVKYKYYVQEWYYPGGYYHDVCYYDVELPDGTVRRFAAGGVVKGKVKK